MSRYGNPFFRDHSQIHQIFCREMRKWWKKWWISILFAMANWSLDLLSTQNIFPMKKEKYLSKPIFFVRRFFFLKMESYFKVNWWNKVEHPISIFHLYLQGASIQGRHFWKRKRKFSFFIFFWPFFRLYSP